MTLILLAFSLTIALGVIAFKFSLYALPVMVGIAVFQYVHGIGASGGFSAISAVGGALLSLLAVVLVVGFARNPFLRLFALLVFTVPAAVAGYALAHGVVHQVVASGIALHLLCGTCGLIVAIAAMANLNAIGQGRFEQ